MHGFHRATTCALFAIVCASGCYDTAAGLSRASEPEVGQADFVSADGADSPPPSALTFHELGADRLYRLLDGQRVLALDSQHGLQVIEISNRRAPRLEGRLAIAGEPVELYIEGEHALVLLNHWRGYAAPRTAIFLDERPHSLVMRVDLSDPAHPRVLGRALAPGQIMASQITRSDTQTLLHVAYAHTDTDERAYLESFDIGRGQLTPTGERDLGRDVGPIVALRDKLWLGAHADGADGASSSGKLLDLARGDGSGALLQSNTIEVAGVYDGRAVDARAGQLRIVSATAPFTVSRSTHLQTFDASDPQHLLPLGHCTFADAYSVDTALFLDDRALFAVASKPPQVLSLAIDAKGTCADTSPFPSLGETHELRATSDGTRVLAVGSNVAQRNQLSVALFDAHAGDAVTPALARVTIDDADYTADVGTGDVALSPIEGAVTATASDGTLETGLFVLPLRPQGLARADAVPSLQLLTHSDHTLTLRGALTPPSPATDLLRVDASTLLVGSARGLDLYDLAELDRPEALASLELTSDYDQLLVFGAYAVRVRDPNPPQAIEQPEFALPKRVEIVALDGDLETQSVLASFEVAGDARLLQVGTLLVSTTLRTIEVVDITGLRTSREHTRIDVYDLGDPTHPRPRGSFDTGDLLESSFHHGLADATRIQCTACSAWQRPRRSSEAYVVGQAIAFVRREAQQRSLGRVHECSVMPLGTDCTGSATAQVACQDDFLTGSLSCTSSADRAEWCTGTLERCSVKTGVCAQIDRPEHGVTEACSDRAGHRHWQSIAFDVLDLRNPDALAFAPRVGLPIDEEGSSVLAQGTSLYVSTQKPITVKDDPRPHVRRFVRKLDFGDPRRAVVGAPINVPGDVIAVDGADLYTRDLLWDGRALRSLIARSTIVDTRALLQATRLFEDASVQEVRVDGAGHILISSRQVMTYHAIDELGRVPSGSLMLTTLDASSMQTVSEGPVGGRAELLDANAGHALLRISGGVLVVDATSRSYPMAQAFYPLHAHAAAPQFVGDEILIAAGPYGIHRVVLTADNLDP